MSPFDSNAGGTTVVMFGASGDLTRRKLIPALYNNFREKRLPAWRLIDPILSGWVSSPQAPPLHTYPINSWGPGAADELLARNGHAWRIGCCGLPCS